MTDTVLLEVTLNDDPDAMGAVHRTLAQTAAFAGNEGIQVLVDETDPHLLVVVESWADLEAHSAYAAWRATPDGAAELARVVAKPPVTRRFASTTGLDGE